MTGDLPHLNLGLRALQQGKSLLIMIHHEPCASAPTYAPTQSSIVIVVADDASNRTIEPTGNSTCFEILRPCLEDDLPRVPEFWERPPKVPPRRIRPVRTRHFRVNRPRVIFQPCWRTGRWKSRT